MKIKKYLMVAIAVVVFVAIAIPAFAAENQTPMYSCAKITGKTIEEIRAERKSGKTCAMIAKEANKLTEFKSAVYKNKKSRLDDMVKNGNISQEKADEILANVKNCQNNCNGTQSGSQNQGQGLGYGNGQGNGHGQGHGQNQGNGQGLRDGSCFK
ncbi:hypothetical protein OKW22_000064 [Bacilli bacterium PM5-3]|nr:hypothetical protein [Bacilli bacterium PM5-3]MDH6603928.1 hypothetical protein [Bacilli bacterium PM5-9]